MDNSNDETLEPLDLGCPPHADAAGTHPQRLSAKKLRADVGVVGRAWHLPECHPLRVDGLV